LVLAFFSLLFPALSQQFTLGFKGDVQTHDDVSGSSVLLPWRLGIEFDALFKIAVDRLIDPSEESQTPVPVS
jgi:hypothetical protein